MKMLPRNLKRYLGLAMLPCLITLCLCMTMRPATAMAAIFTPITGYNYDPGGVGNTYGFTTTLLNNGKVLITGGTDGSGTGPFASLALFDPASGKLTTLDAALATARYNHTATLLRDGRVVIAGGTTVSGTPTTTCEIFDPVNGSISAGPAMNAPHSGHTATLLIDGRVLFTGGAAGSSMEIANAGISGFATVTDNGIDRFGHTATLLPDGRVLIAGGSGGEARAEIFNPVSGTLAATGTLMVGRSNHTATLLGNGTVLIIGGMEAGSGPLDSGEVYIPNADPALGSFATIGPWLNNARFSHSATLLPNGTVLVAGGWDGTTPLASAEIYDMAVDTITPEAASMYVTRYEQSATLLPSGDVFITGGHDSSAEIYSYATPSTPASPTPGALTSAHAYGTTTLLPDGRVLIAGGNDSGETRAVELYDPISGQAVAISPLATARYRHTATLLPNGRVLIAGGAVNGEGDQAISAVEIYDPVTRVSISVPPLSAARFRHTATLLPDGRVLVAGGVDANYDVLNTAVIFNPATGNFTTVTMTAQRSEHAATLLADGRVLITGGREQSGATLKTAEIFDPVANSFSALPAVMTTPRRGHFSLPLADGTVLIASGINEITTEIFDPLTQTFAATANQPSSEHREGTATVLADGRVLLADGYAAFATNTKDIYDPATRQFLSAATGAALYGHMTTLLADGTVLLSSDSWTNRYSNELFSLDLGDVSALRPVLSGISTTGGRIAVTGSGFRGISESSSGTNAASATDYPLLKLQRLADGAIRYFAVDPASGWSDTAVTSLPLYNMPLGHYMAAVIVNGVPSIGKVIRIDRNLSVNPASFDFPNSTISSTSNQIINFCNTGAASITVSGLAISGTGSPFAIDTTAESRCGALPFTLPANTCCWGDITFTPAAAGLHMDTLEIISNDAIAPSLSVPLQGNILPPRYDLTLALSGLATGTVTVSAPSEPNLTCTSGTCFQTYPSGATVTLTATPGANTSIAWTGCDSVTGGSGEICTVAVNGAKSITATFNFVSTFTVGTSVTPLNGGSISPAPATTQTVPLNGTVTATITVTPGWHIQSVGFNSGALIPGTASAVYGQPGTYTYTTPAITASGTIEVVFEPGIFSVIGSTTIRRFEPTTTLLNDGRILIAGGFGPASGTLATAEIYDPATNTSAPTGSMAAGRAEHAAVLLPNGKVLITGGWSGDGSFVVGSAEVYDPTSGTFTAAGANMGAIRARHTMTLLPDGNVLIVGGIQFAGGTDTVANSAEIYNTYATSPPYFSATTGALADELYNHTATLVATPGHTFEGQVLISGGNNATGTATDKVKLYNPSTGSFTDIGVLNAGRYRHTATLLSDGRIVVTGGQPSKLTAALNSAEYITYTAGVGWSFTTLAKFMTEPRTAHSASLLPNGKVLIAGGFPNPMLSTLIQTSEVFDPVSGTFNKGSDMSEARQHAKSVLMADGRVLIVGGGASANIDIYQYAAGGASTSATANNMATAREQHSAVLLPDGKVLIAGGTNGSDLNSKDIYNPSTKTFSTTANNMNRTRVRPNMVLLRSGLVLIAGGQSETSAELYDSSNDSFTLIGPTMNSVHHQGTATLLPDGRVLITGGYDGTTYTASTEIYDPLTNFSAAPPSMNVGRLGHTATLLRDGRVLIVGGQGFGGGVYYDSAEIFTPTTGVFTMAASKLSTNRYNHAAVLLEDGKVLIVGGDNGTGIRPPAEIYDPSTDTFTAFPLSNNLSWNDTTPPQAVLLQNGTVLIVRGSDLADIYDPATKAFVPTAAWGGSFNNQSVSLLPDGTVLMTGGYNGALPTASARIYDPGLGFAAGRRPIMSPSPTTEIVNSVLTAPSGTRFLGDSEASAGGSTGSSSGIPVVKIQRIEGGQSIYLGADTAMSWNSSTFTSSPFTAMPGHYLATLFAAGVPSESVIVAIDPAAAIRLSSQDMALPAMDLGAATPMTKDLYIYNDGNGGALQINSISKGGTDSTFFAIQPPSLPSDCGATFPFSLAAGQSCRVGINFLPPSNAAANLGSRSAVITITSDDPVFSSLTVALKGNVTTTATVTFAGTGSGMVSRNLLPSSYASYTGSFSYTTTTSSALELTAYAYFGSTPSWSGCDSITPGANPVCNITIPASKAPTITFDLIPYAINATVFSGNGTATPQSPTVTVYATTAVDITPAIGYQLAAITDNGTQVPFTPTQGGYTFTYSITNVQENHAVEVTFAPGATTLLAAAQDNREFHTASLLPDGRLLLAGGQDDVGRALRTARIFDPATGTSSATGVMNAARVFHTATALPDGRVLIIGGNDGANSLATAELYDPATGTFTATGSMAFARDAHTATLLPDNTVLIAGGGNSQIEIYDWLTGTFTAPPSAIMSSDRNYHTATLLTDGTVLIAGGWDGTATVDTADIYDPFIAVINGTLTMNSPRDGHSATLLPDNSVLFAGGDNGQGAVATAEIFDGAFTTTADMTWVRDLHSATLLPDGKVLMAGGWDGTNATGPMEIYDFNMASFYPAGSLKAPRLDHTATILPGGRVALTGGWNGTNVLASTEFFSPGTNVFQSDSFMADMRGAAASVTLIDGTVLVAGGDAGDGFHIDTAEMYSLAGGFAATSPMSISRAGATATLMTDGNVLVAGGDSSFTITNTTEVYLPASGTFDTTIAAPMNAPRSRHTATLLADSRVLLTGGRTDTFGTVLNSAEIYDLADGSFTPTAGIMGYQRVSHTATLLADGRVLIVGGNDTAGTPANSAEIYDPIADTFTPISAALLTGITSHSATLLPNGRVLIAGGMTGGGNATSYAALFNPADSSFSTVSDSGMTSPRAGHSATLLPDGRVLLAGGWDPATSTNALAADIYDPASNIFSAGPSLSEGRRDHTAQLLPDGRILLAGGYIDSVGTTTSSEVFDVGLGTVPTRQPAISGVTLPPASAAKIIRLTGTGFTETTTGTNGSFASSASTYPMVQLTRIDSGATRFISPAAGSSRGSTWFDSATVNNLQEGSYRLTVFTNGVASLSSIIPIDQYFAGFPVLAVTPANPDLGSVTVGGTTTFFMTLQNNGLGSLNVSDIAISGTDYTLDVTGGVSPCAATTPTIAPGGLCTVAVVLTPTTIATLPGSLTISSDDPINPTVTISLTGTGVASPNFTVTPSAGTGGTISPAIPQTVVLGATTSFTITADTANGYNIAAVSGCGGTWTGTNPYITGAVTADCAVTATFAQASFTVTPSAGTGGTISAAVPQTITFGGTTSFTVSADTANGYSIASVSGCGGTWTGTNPYVTGAVTADCAVTATFVQTSFTVTPSAGTGGTISAALPQTVAFGGTTSFTVTADTANGYHIASVSGCGGIWTGANPYITGAVSANCNVAASFALDTFRATLQATGGSIDGPTTVTYGSMPTYTIAGDGDHKLVDVSVNGVSVGAVTSYTFTTPVTGAVNVVATFGAIADGDITQNDGLPAGQVSIADALKALRIAVGLMVATPQDLLHGDVAPLVGGVPAPDGRIDHRDALVLLRKVVGLVNW